MDKNTNTMTKQSTNFGKAISSDFEKSVRRNHYFQTLHNNHCMGLHTMIKKNQFHSISGTHSNIS